MGELERGAKPPSEVLARRRGRREADRPPNLGRSRQRVVRLLDAREALEDLRGHRGTPPRRLAHVDRHQLVRRRQIAFRGVEHRVEIMDALGVMLEEQRGVCNKGASMRLGTWPTKIVQGTLAEKIYGQGDVVERHRHRYEFNMKYRDRMTEKGFTISGTSPDGTLAELIELRDHPYFLACQYHPEFQSKPNKPHPLFKAFIQACLAHPADGAPHVATDPLSPHRVHDRELVPQR